MPRNCPRLEGPLAEAADNHWTRFVEVIKGLPDVDLADGGLSPGFLETCSARAELRTVWAASDFVPSSCIRNPQLLDELLTSGDLDRRYPVHALLENITDQLAQCIDEKAFHQRLRLIRRREMVRLAWRDLSGMSDLEETIAGVSELADGCIINALHFHQRALETRYGQPQGNNGDPANMVVLGLGKLGGYELNYSSDVDLIFAFDLPGATAHPDKDKAGIDNQEFFIRLGQKLVAALDEITPDGQVFRTDMRLRPNGASGPLVLSFPAMEHYYQTHGRNWERYALIKARQVAGNKNAGDELLAMLKPFIYRKYLDFGAFDSIREMKAMIQRELKQKGLQHDIKLGWGGIREIEFLVQSHQLIRGGREKRLRTQSLYQAITALQSLGVLDDSVLDGLIEGYEFLRNTEHRLQMVADRQTQQLPTTGFEQARLAFSMGFDNWFGFVARLDQLRSEIHSQFKLILEGEAGQTGTIDNSRFQLVDVWEGKLDRDDAIATLLSAGFSKADSTPQLLYEFRRGRLYQAFSGIERDRIDRLIPLALQQAANHGEAERGIAAFISVLESIGRRSAYLSLLIENPIALKQLLHLCAASPWISNHIGQHPVILDELLNPLIDIRNRDHASLEVELNNRLEQIDEDDDEARMNGLREFQQAQVLRIAAADVSGVLRVDDVHQALTRLAEVLLQMVLADAIAFVCKKRGPAPCEAGVIAYGKFASGELGYNSDLDVVVCYDLDEYNSALNKGDIEMFFSRVGRRLIHLITTRTQAGNLYALDMRLRPSGRSGTLVTSLNGFFDYQMNDAWTWEHQALVRSRVVSGSSGFIIKFESARKAIIVMARDDQQLKADVITMRQKMIQANCQSTTEHYDLKLDEGGIVDIEFLIQYWVLRHASDQVELVEPRTMGEFVAGLTGLGLIELETGEQLLDCYQTYLRQSLDLKLMDLPVLARQDQLLDQRKAISTIWNNTFNPVV